MKIFDAGTLQSVLDADLTWRRKDVSALIGLAQIASLSNQQSLIRASIPILYAHWEGFVRNCFVRYFELVAQRRIKFSALTFNFLFLASRSDLSQIGQANYSDELPAFERLFSRPEKQNRDHFRQLVNTKSNLRSDVLSDLFLIAGLAPPFSGKDTFIDKDLCDSRNDIAHGGGGAPKLSVIVSRRDEAFALMAAIQGAIVNAALQKTYLKLAGLEEQ